LRCRYGNFDGNSHGDFYGDFHGDFALTQTQQPCQYNLVNTTSHFERHYKSNRKQPNATARATESSTAN
jgi:hypothetical protein